MEQANKKEQEPVVENLDHLVEDVDHLVVEDMDHPVVENENVENVVEDVDHPAVDDVDHPVVNMDEQEEATNGIRAIKADGSVIGWYCTYCSQQLQYKNVGRHLRSKVHTRKIIAVLRRA